MPFFWNFINYGSPAILLLGSIIGIYYYKVIQKYYKVIVWYFVVSFIVDLLHRAVVYSHLMSYNLFLIPLFGIIELFLFDKIYTKVLLAKKRILGQVIRYIIFLVLLAEFFYTLTKTPESYYSFGKIAVNLYVIIASILYFHKIFSEATFLKNETPILFNSGVLSYFTFNLLINVSINFLINEELQIVFAFWVANGFITVVFYAFNTYLIWKNWQKPETFAFWLALVIIVSMVLVITIIVIVQVYFRRILAEQRKIAQLELDHQEKLIADSIKIQERERKRIAADLHDHLISKLNIIRLSLYSLKGQPPPAIFDSLTESIDLGRKISHDLSPPLLENSSIDELFSEFLHPIRDNYDISFQLLFQDELELKPAIKLQMVRIFQEVINNILKHASAKKIKVYLRQSEKLLILKVEDDGKGFDPEAAKKWAGPEKHRT